MIRLGKLTDYAIVVMTSASRPDGELHSVARLAERTGIPAPTVAKLVKILAGAGLMESRRGASGGYVLARDPAHLTVAEIVTAVEGPIAITSCVSESADACGVETLCPMRGGWEKINLALRSALNGVTLADMTGPPLLPPHSHRDTPPSRSDASESAT